MACGASRCALRCDLVYIAGCIMTKGAKGRGVDVDLSREEINRILPIINNAMSYSGGPKQDGHLSFTELESAVGALVTGQLFGYRVLELVHSFYTRKKYCAILGIESFRDVCPAHGPYSDRHYLYRAMSKVTDWYRGRYGADGVISIADKRKRVVVDDGA